MVKIIGEKRPKVKAVIQIAVTEDELSGKDRITVTSSLKEQPEIAKNILRIAIGLIPDPNRMSNDEEKSVADKESSES